MQTRVISEIIICFTYVEVIVEIQHNSWEYLSDLELIPECSSVKTSMFELCDYKKRKAAGILNLLHSEIQGGHE